MKKYLTVFFTLSFFAIGSVFFANYFFDPFFLKSSPSFLEYRYVDNERQIKTNIMLNNTPKFDALLIGTSRTGNIWTNFFKKNKVFNYSASALNIKEYMSYIKIAYAQQPFKKLYIGLDQSSMFQSEALIKSDFYEKNAKHWIYQLFDYKGLFLIDKSIKASKNKFIKKINYYDEDLNKIYKIDTLQKKEDILKYLKLTQEELKKRSAYIWNEDLKNIFNEITDFCLKNKIEKKIFITPEIEPFFYLTYKPNRLFYEKWIRLCVEKFHTIYDFTGSNVITKSTKNFFDTSHFDQTMGEILATILEGRITLTPQKNMGAYVTKDTLESHLANIRKQAEGADKDPIGTFEKLAETD